MTERMVQFSIFLGNKPGMLGKICRELAKSKINIVGLTMVDTSEHGVLRIVPQNPDRARTALDKLNVPMAETRVLAVTMPNRPGVVADVCEKLSAERVKISYLYGTTGAPGGKAVGIFKVGDVKKAEKVLETKRAPKRDTKVKLRNRQRTKAAGRK